MAGRKKRSDALARYREARAATSRDLKQARSSGVVSSVRLLVSANDCRICQSIRAKVFPIADCTLDMLPPYGNCENEDGCRASIAFNLDNPDKAGRGLFGWIKALTGK